MKIYEIDYDLLDLDGQTVKMFFGHQMIVCEEPGFTGDASGVSEVEMTLINKRRAATALREMAVSFDEIDEDTKSMILVLELPTHSEYRANALLKIDTLHASFMTELTGKATTEERDTWPAKVDASRFIMQADDTTLTAEVTKVLEDDPFAPDDLETLVFDVGSDLSDLRALAVDILTKSRAFKRLIGLASKIRREAKAGAIGATDESVPIENVGAALDAMELEISTQINAAVAQLKGG